MRAGLLETVENTHARVAPGIDVKPSLPVHLVIGDDGAAERAVQDVTERVHCGIVGTRNEEIDFEIVTELAWSDFSRPIVEVQTDSRHAKFDVRDGRLGQCFLDDPRIRRASAIGSVRPIACMMEARKRPPSASSRSHWSVTVNRAAFITAIRLQAPGRELGREDWLA